MERTDSAVYHHPAIVTTHPLYPACGSTLDRIAAKDYPGGAGFPTSDDSGETIHALDMDAYESGLSGNNDCTVDAVIGICNERHGCPANGRLLPVELKIDCMSGRGPDKHQVMQKDSHTRDLLRGCPDTTRTDPMLAIVFHPDKEAVMFSWVSRMRRESAKMADWRAFTPETMLNFINWGRQMPYTPARQTTQLADTLGKVAETGDMDAFETVLGTVRSYYDLCLLRYDMGECTYLAGRMHDAMSSLTRSVRPKGPDTDLMLEILAEEIPAV